jgi:hypothetical protein
MPNARVFPRSVSFKEEVEIINPVAQSPESVSVQVISVPDLQGKVSASESVSVQVISAPDLQGKVSESVSDQVISAPALQGKVSVSESVSVQVVSAPDLQGKVSASESVSAQVISEPDLQVKASVSVSAKASKSESYVGALHSALSGKDSLFIIKGCFEGCPVDILIDSGARGLGFISQTFISKNGLQTSQGGPPQKIILADGQTIPSLGVS